jgi:hypothetical protein
MRRNLLRAHPAGSDILVVHKRRVQRARRFAAAKSPRPQELWMLARVRQWEQFGRAEGSTFGIIP